jgi:hypothetical protein
MPEQKYQRVATAIRMRFGGTLERNSLMPEQKYQRVVVRWHDGYLEEFNCDEVRFGNHLLWMRLVTRQNRHIPLASVRWFSLTPESHEHVPAGPIIDRGAA